MCVRTLRCLWTKRLHQIVTTLSLPLGFKIMSCHSFDLLGSSLGLSRTPHLTRATPKDLVTTQTFYDLPLHRSPVSVSPVLPVGTGDALTTVPLWCQVEESSFSRPVLVSDVGPPSSSPFALYLLPDRSFLSQTPKVRRFETSIRTGPHWLGLSEDLPSPTTVLVSTQHPFRKSVINDKRPFSIPPGCDTIPPVPTFLPFCPFCTSSVSTV